MREEKYIKYGLFSSILIALGPILWLFMNIYDKNYEDYSFKHNFCYTWNYCSIL